MKPQTCPHLPQRTLSDEEINQIVETLATLFPKLETDLEMETLCHILDCLGVPMPSDLLQEIEQLKRAAIAPREKS